MLLKTNGLPDRKIGTHTMRPETTPTSTGAITGPPGGITGPKSGQFLVPPQNQKTGLVGLPRIGNVIAGNLPAGSANGTQRRKGQDWLLALRCGGAKLTSPRLARSAVLSLSQADYTGTTFAAMSSRFRFNGSVHSVMAESTPFGEMQLNPDSFVARATPSGALMVLTRLQNNSLERDQGRPLPAATIPRI